MIEMKLNPAATIHTVRLDPVCIVPYQKSRELSYFPLVTQQIRLGRTLLRKFHKNTIITEIDIQVELIETHIDDQRPGVPAALRYCVDHLADRPRRMRDDVSAGAPEPALRAHHIVDL